MGKKRKDGYLRTSFSLNGKRYYIYGRDREELVQKEQEKREELEQVYTNNSNPTLYSYYDNWKERKRDSVTEATMRSYKIYMNVLKQYVIPKINMSMADILVKKISINEITKVQRMMIDEGRHSDTINGALKFAKRLLEDCRRERIIDYNPFDLWKPIKRTEEQVRETIHRALTKEEQKKFFECDKVKVNSYYNLFRFAILTGMRFGEIVALQYRDIKSGFINVRRTTTMREDGSYKIGEEAKTKAGMRTIPLTDQIKSVLHDQRERNILLGRETIGLEDRIFTSVNGNIPRHCRITTVLHKLCEAAGIEYFSVHSLRATFATRCIENGMDVKTLQEILGHANYNLTMSLYGHCLEDTKKEQMEKLKIVI